jgi:peptidoglycan/LPS O-acetylase OafA/YrhL
MSGSLRAGGGRRKKAVQESASESFWNLLREWSTRVSRWKRWKKTALAFTSAFILLVIFVLATSTPQEANKLKR